MAINPIALAFGGQLGLAKDLPDWDMSLLLKKAEKDAAQRSAVRKAKEDLEKDNMAALDMVFKLQPDVMMKANRATMSNINGGILSFATDIVSKANAEVRPVTIQEKAAIFDRVRTSNDFNAMLKYKEQTFDTYSKEIEKDKSIYNVDAKVALTGLAQDNEATADIMHSMMTSNSKLMNQGVVMDKVIRDNLGTLEEIEYTAPNGQMVKMSTYPGLVDSIQKGNGVDYVRGADGQVKINWNRVTPKLSQDPLFMAFYNDNKELIANTYKKNVDAVTMEDGAKFFLQDKIPVNVSLERAPQPTGGGGGGSMKEGPKGLSGVTAGGEINYYSMKENRELIPHRTYSFADAYVVNKDSSGNSKDIEVSLSNVKALPVGGASATNSVDMGLQTFSKENATYKSMKIVPWDSRTHTLASMTDKDMMSISALMDKPTLNENDIAIIKKITNNGRIQLIWAAEVQTTIGRKDVVGGESSQAKRGAYIRTAKDYQESISANARESLDSGMAKSHESYIIPLELEPNHAGTRQQIMLSLGYEPNTSLTSFSSPYYTAQDRDLLRQRDAGRKRINGQKKVEVYNPFE